MLKWAPHIVFAQRPRDCPVMVQFKWCQAQLSRMRTIPTSVRRMHLSARKWVWNSENIGEAVWNAKPLNLHVAEENSLSKDRGKPSPVIFCWVCTGTMRLKTLPVHTSRQSYSTVLDFPQLRNSKHYYKDASDYIYNKTFYLFLFGCWFATHIIQLPSQLQHFIDNKTFTSFFGGLLTCYMSHLQEPSKRKIL